MEENKNKNLNRQDKSIDYASLISSAVGAVAGVVGANAVQSATAAPVIDPEPEPTPTPTPHRPTPAPKPEPTVTVDDNVTIVYKETIDMGNGQMADIAIGVTPQGSEVDYIDVDRDGIIDFRVEDSNHDGNISENEVIDVQTQNIHMDDLMHQAEVIAQLPDYNPEANVDEFLA